MRGECGSLYEGPAGIGAGAWRLPRSSPSAQGRNRSRDFRPARQAGPLYGERRNSTRRGVSRSPNNPWASLSFSDLIFGALKWMQGAADSEGDSRLGTDGNHDPASELQRMGGGRRRPSHSLAARCGQVGTKLSHVHPSQSDVSRVRPGWFRPARSSCTRMNRRRGPSDRATSLRLTRSARRGAPFASCTRTCRPRPEGPVEPRPRPGV